MIANLKTSSLQQTLLIGKKLGANLKGGEVIELRSDLGSGKTTFTKGLVLGTGSHELVSSPSFTICNEYQAPRFKIYHFDFYRLNDPGIIKRELSEIIDEPSNVIVIEWPEAIENILPSDRVVISIKTTDENSREIDINYSKQSNYLIKGLK